MLFSFKDIFYTLGPANERRILASGSLDSGDVLVVRGPSGSGKSTLLRILARLQPCTGGEAFLNGESWLRIPGIFWRPRIHYLAQKPALFDGTVADNLAMPFQVRVLNSEKEFDRKHARSIMESLLLPLSMWEQDARTVSGGEASRLAFARSLLIDPHVLLLDEPTAALDINSREAFYRVLSGWLGSSGHAAILVSHHNDLQYINRASFLDL